jgi:hypothetical protein
MSVLTPTRARRRLLAGLVGGLGMVVAIAGALLERAHRPGVALLVTGLAVVAVTQVVWWRCQHCRRYLGRVSGRGHCPHCGQSLDAPPAAD